MRAWVSNLATHAGALLGVAAALCALAQVSSFVTDDAAITLRYAAQLAAGHGLRWNPGEHPVEGYSNFSHVLLGAAALELGLPALSVLRLFNQLSMLAVCVLSYALAWHVLRNRLWATVAGVFVGAHGALAYWASSGLESASYVAASYAALLATTRVRTGRELWPALPFLLAALTRLEGVVVFLAALFGLVLDACYRRESVTLRLHARWVLACAGAYGAYFAFRFFYFGHLLSNSAYFKLRDPSGFRLIMQYVGQNGALLALAAFADLRRLGRFGTSVLALALAYGVGLYGVKDSVADFHRFFLPLVPASAVLAVSALARIETYARLGRARQLLAGLACGLALAFDLRHPVSGLANLHAEAALLNTRIVSRAAVARLLAERLPADAPVAVDDVGVIGYVLQNPIEDLFGLNNERFIHEFGRDRQRYVRATIATRPAAVVVASRNPRRFHAAYATGWVVTRAPRFGHDYEQLAVIASPAEDYHYFVYVRRDLGPLPQRRELALLRDRPLARAVDALYLDARRTR